MNKKHTYNITVNNHNANKQQFRLTLLPASLLWRLTRARGSFPVSMLSMIRRDTRSPKPRLSLHPPHLQFTPPVKQWSYSGVCTSRWLIQIIVYNIIVL